MTDELTPLVVSTSAPWPPALAAAFVAAQAAMPTINKDRTARVDTRGGGSYSYTYADLATALEAVRPILAAHGLAVMQEPITRQNRIDVFTTLVHSSGESQTWGPLTFPAGDTPQAAGSAITYARRYALLAALGIATEDDDGQAAAVRPSADRERQTATSGGAKAASRSGRNRRSSTGNEEPSAAPATVQAVPLPLTVTDADWQAAPHADRVALIGSVLASIPDEAQRRDIRAGFRDEFPPDPGLTEDVIGRALDWLAYVGLVVRDTEPTIDDLASAELTPAELRDIADAVGAEEH